MRRLFVYNDDHNDADDACFGQLLAPTGFGHLLPPLLWSPVAPHALVTHTVGVTCCTPPRELHVTRRFGFRSTRPRELSFYINPTEGMNSGCTVLKCDVF